MSEVAALLIEPEEVWGLIKFFSIIGGSILILLIAGFLLRRKFVRQKTTREEQLLFLNTRGQGILKNLTAIEAGIVMNIDLPRLLTMYILDLASYGDIRILSHVKLKFEVRARDEIPAFRKLFLAAVNEDASLDVDKALDPLDHVYRNLKKQLRDYNIQETAEYYYTRVDSLWNEIETEKTAEERLDTFHDWFSWLMLHDNYENLLEDKFRYSGIWLKVEPVGDMYRVITRRLLKYEDLLRHLARYPDGLLSAPFYRNDIVNWTRELIEIHRAPPKIGEIEALYHSPKAQYGALEYYTKKYNLAQEARQLLDKIEGKDQ